MPLAKGEVSDCPAYSTIESPLKSPAMPTRPSPSRLSVGCVMAVAVSACVGVGVSAVVRRRRSAEAVVGA